ncbi:MAG: hypothetical protein A3F12_05915 [Gammaproteobacteria bacterium RIFCSPHIGHO2_12_FULL_38_14]|nr:MAG: hypothetical protein A3F12_05915 [Gammaproteobacteria bacterium RIFCSPHIGHO2_12_FULL_38_14]
MRYKYRYIYSVLLVLSFLTVDYLYDIKPHFQEINQLAFHKSELSKEVYHFRNRKNIFIQNVENQHLAYKETIKNSVILSFMSILNQSGISHPSINLMHEAVFNDRTYYIRITGLGRFDSVLKFLSLIRDEKINLLQFKISLKRETLHFIADFLIPRGYKWPKNKLMVIHNRIINPFCSSNKDPLHLTFDDVNNIKPEAIYQLQLIGVIEKKQHFFAVLMINHHFLTIVSEGILWNKYVIRHIFKDSLDIYLGGRKVKLTLQGKNHD